MTTNTFRIIALALRDHVSDSYALLAATDSIESVLPELTRIAAENETMRQSVRYDTHEHRVLAAIRSETVLAYMQEGKKINAIKELRAVASCGLKEAKDAIEDDRVADAAGVDRYRPW